MNLILLHRVHWLAEQGLAPKRAFLVIIPLLIFIGTELFVNRKERESMNNSKKALDVLNVAVKVICNLSGNIAGGALLANALYGD